MPKDNGYAARDKEIERLREVVEAVALELQQMATHPQVPRNVGVTLERLAKRLQKEMKA
jgi:hypothetical protein